MSVAIVTLTSAGVTLAQKIKPFFGQADIYTQAKHKVHGVIVMDGPLRELNRQLFKDYTLIIYVMATGIVVRTIAPYCQCKQLDPAILVIDEAGQHVISLLSGHLGGANRWARRLADYIKATPVITTSSDVNEVLAVDEVAEGLNLGITDFEKAKDITAMIVEKKVVHIVSRDNLFEQSPTGLLYIGDEKPKAIGLPYVWLTPKRLVAGIGCQKGMSYENIYRFMKHCCDQINRPITAIDKLVSVDIKQDEEGLRQLARSLRVPFETYSPIALNQVMHRFKGSPFVMEQIGVAAVSEPAGYLGSYGGPCLLAVQKMKGMTISLWTYEEEDV